LALQAACACRLGLLFEAVFDPLRVAFCGPELGLEKAIF